MKVGELKIYPGLITILSRHGQPVGTGFLVTPDRAITCAHVVNAACGRNQDSEDQPAAQINLHIPFSDEDTSAQIVGWFPGGRRGDVAVLKLTEPLRCTPKPLPVSIGIDVKGRMVETCGFPPGNADRTPDLLWKGVISRGVCSALRLDGSIQLITGHNEPPIVPGFSGAPAWDPQAECVVGMIVARSDKSATGYDMVMLLPSSRLRECCPEIILHNSEAERSLAITRFCASPEVTSRVSTEGGKHASMSENFDTRSSFIVSNWLNILSKRVWRPALLRLLGRKLRLIDDDLQAITNMTKMRELVELYVEPDCELFVPGHPQVDSSQVGTLQVVTSRHPLYEYLKSLRSRLFPELGLVAPRRPLYEYLNKSGREAPKKLCPVTPRRPLYEYLNWFLSEEDFRKVEGGGESQLLLVSDAGMGKTASLLMIKLAFLNGFVPSKYECVLRRIGKNTIHELERMSERRTKVLLLDALDEASSDAKATLSELLSYTSDFYRVIITCRTAFLPLDDNGDLETGHSRPLIRYISPFSDLQVERFLRGKFRTRSFIGTKMDQKRIDIAQWLVNAMRDLKMRPLLLTYIDHLMPNQDELTRYLAASELRSRFGFDFMPVPSGLTDYLVFQQLIASWIEAEVAKLRQKHKDLANRSPGEQEENFRRACSAVARCLQGQEYFEKRSIDRYQLHEVLLDCFSHSQEKVDYKDLVDYLMALEIDGRSLLTRNMQGQISFAHMAIQEFLVAKWILSSDQRAAGLEHLKLTDQICQFIRSALLSQRERTLLERPNLTGLPFQGSSLHDLSGLDLRGANLEGANLEDVNMAKTRMDKATRLAGSSMKKADLSNAVLECVDLTGLNLQQATLNHTQLRDCTLNGADLRHATADHSDFTGVVFMGPTTFHPPTPDSQAQVLLEGVKAHNAILAKADLTGGNLRGANLGDANLAGAKLRLADLREAQLVGADLRGTDLSFAQAEGCDFRHAKINSGTLWKGMVSDERTLLPDNLEIVAGGEVRMKSTPELSPSSSEELSDFFPDLDMLSDEELLAAARRFPKWAGRISMLMKIRRMHNSW